MTRSHWQKTNPALVRREPRSGPWIPDADPHCDDAGEECATWPDAERHAYYSTNIPTAPTRRNHKEAAK